MSASTLSRFQGTLLGVLVGDCLGGPFEGSKYVSKAHLNKYFAKMLDPSVRLPFKTYTDDTAMTKSVALSLIQCRRVDPMDMAKRFVSEYNADPKRGYGATVGDVFQNLHLTAFEDPFGPASRQFGGMGSYGNGAAMRISPVPLFTHSTSDESDDLSTLLAAVETCSKVTHSNPLGIRGAILHAIAVRAALRHKAGEKMDTTAFTNGLIDIMAQVEGADSGKAHMTHSKLDKDPETSYVKKLEIVRSFLALNEPPHREEIEEVLGTAVSAHRSVPTALYCFLAAQKPIPEIETDNVFQRALMLSFHLGGDTDTIGSMAGALAGAQFGLDGIPSGLLKHCEATKQAVQWGEDLFNLAETSSSASSKGTQRSS